jgi:hypothetical protein
MLIRAARKGHTEAEVIDFGGVAVRRGNIDGEHRPDEG